MLRTKNQTYVALVVDQSSSMSHLARPVVDAVNRILGELNRPDVLVSTYFFSDTVKRILDRVPGSDILPITRGQYNPSGWTALNDAIITALDGIPSGAVGLVYVLTDGQENRSKFPGFAAIMRDAVRNEKITFAIQGPQGIHTYTDPLGIPRENVTTWEQTWEGVKEAEEKTSGGILRYMAARDAGETSFRSFYK